MKGNTMTKISIATFLMAITGLLGTFGEMLYILPISLACGLYLIFKCSQLSKNSTSGGENDF